MSAFQIPFDVIFVPIKELKNFSTHANPPNQTAAPDD
jgi:hypothetical protein